MIENELNSMPLMTVEDQIAVADSYLRRYREQQLPIDPNVTLWFESVLESLHRLKSLQR